MTDKRELPDLDNLTPEQEATVEKIRDKWIAIGNSTEPVDRAAAEQGIDRAYRDAGLKPPSYRIWVPSPYAGAIAIGIVPDAIDAAMDLVELAVKDITDVPTDETKRKKYTMPAVPVDEKAVQDWWRTSTYGQHSAGYFAYLECLKELGYPDLEKVEGPLQVAANVGWWWPAEDFVICTERPVVIKRDQNNLLHAEDGPALAYPDGWGVWAWHGTQVPKELIMGQWSTDRILKERNAEVRRCAIEKMGWDRFIAEAKLKQIGKNMDDPGNPGHELALYEVPAQLYPEPVRVLLCDNATPERDGTRRRFGLTVPSEMRNPVQAAAWTFNLTEAEYRRLQRAT